MNKYLIYTDFLIKFYNTIYLFNLQYNIIENNIFAILLNISYINEKQFQNFFLLIYIF